MTATVLIAGAGPVGLTLALELVRFGTRVRIVDKAASRTNKSKALVVWSRTLELLERSGCAEAFLAAGFRCHGAVITAGDRRIGRVELTEIESEYDFALMLPQSETERLLEEALDRLGVTVERQTELTGITQGPDHVTATLHRADGSAETVESAFLVGCDGAHSTVRHQIGLKFDGDTQQSDWLLADCHLAGPGLSGDALDLFWNEDGVLAVFPITPGRARVIADIGLASGTRRPDPTLAEIQTVLDRRGPGGITASDPIWLSSFRINERKVKEYRTGRIFLAGDAAHIHSPAGGQGMNTGMQDAFNLAWKLALRSRGAASDLLLDSYSPERSAVGQAVLENAGRLTSLAVLRSHALQTIRNTVARFALGLAPVRHKMADTLSEITIGYRDLPLTGPGGAHGGPAPGDRAPPRPGVTPPGAGGESRFALFTADPEAATLAARFHGLVEPELRLPYAQGFTWLVRPDGYVGATATDGDWETLAGYLMPLSSG